MKEFLVVALFPDGVVFKERTMAYSIDDAITRVKEKYPQTTEGGQFQAKQFSAIYIKGNVLSTVGLHALGIN